MQPWRIWVKSTDAKPQHNTTNHKTCWQFLRWTVRSDNKRTRCYPLTCSWCGARVFIGACRWNYEVWPWNKYTACQRIITRASCGSRLFMFTGHLGNRWRRVLKIPHRLSVGTWLSCLPLFTKAEKLKHVERLLKVLLARRIWNSLFAKYGTTLIFLSHKVFSDKYFSLEHFVIFS